MSQPAQPAPQPAHRARRGQLVPRAFTPGDKALNFLLADLNGQDHDLYAEVVGEPIVLMVLRTLFSAQARALLAALERAKTQLEESGAQVVLVAGDTPSIAGGAKLPEGLDLLLLCDPVGHVLNWYLAAETTTGDNELDEAPPLRSYLLDPNQRVIASWANEAPEQHVSGALDAMEAWRLNSNREAAFVAPPALVLPRIFEPELCDHLIGLWQTSHQEGSLSTGREHLYAPNKKRNLEHLIEDEETINRIRKTLGRRVLPEINKVFNYSDRLVMEGFIVLCYQVERGDFFDLHRDRYTPQQPRRFALSLNLNEGFEGGELCFPEYAGAKLKPPRGGGCIFSCSLLHKALPVSRGQRFVMTTFFNKPETYGAEQANFR